jgi:RNA polymerase sigma-70 factor (ECF subfamily)
MKIDFAGDHASANGCNTAARVWRADLDDDLRRDILAHLPGLRHYARALTRDAAVAEDLVQECLCRAFAKIHLWEKGTDLRAWLFTILHHQHISEIRRAARRGASVAIEDIAPTLAVTAAALSALQLRDLERAIASLPEAQRRVILLVGVKGMEYKDAAAALGIPIGTVRSRIARGRAALRKLMDREDDATTVQATTSDRDAIATGEAADSLSPAAYGIGRPPVVPRTLPVA